MLPLHYLFENYDLARYALQNWPHDASSLEETLTHFRISSNAVYPYLHEDSLCFLRLSPAEEKLESDLGGEFAHILYLRKNSYPALQPLPAHNGEMLLTLDTPWGIWYASAFAGVPGKPIEELPHTPALLHAYGEALGRLHTLSRGQNFGKQTHEDALAWMEAQLLCHRAPQSALDELKAVADALSQLPKIEETYGPVHYDFEPDNVFYDEATDSCHVIDFEDGMMHFYALDIEQALAELPEEEHADFIEGYQTQFPYTEQTASLRPLMRRFCDLYAYTRLLRCLAEPPKEQPDWMQELLPFLTDKLHALENGFSGLMA